MFGVASKESSDAKRLVLGFDGGCWTCSEIARRVEEQVGNKIEVMSLQAPQAQEWREKALGEDVPWAPTLFEVNGSKVQAWTGLRMGVQLRRFLGPVATWRVMQILGEVGTASVVEEPSVAKVAGSFTRRQFLKDMGGAAIAMSVLSTTGKFARQAEAATITKSTELTGSTLIKTARKRAKTKDMINVGGQAWSDGMQTGAVTHMRDSAGHDYWFICNDPSKGCSPRLDANGTFVLDDGTTAIKAVKHTYSNGNTMTAVTYGRSSDQVMYSYQYSTPIRSGHFKSEAGKYKQRSAGSSSFLLKALSVNGSLVTLPRSGAFSAQQVCSGCDANCNGDLDITYCSDLETGCFFIWCAGCAYLSRDDWRGVAFCALALCPWLYYDTSKGCCNSLDTAACAPCYCPTSGT